MSRKQQLGDVRRREGEPRGTQLEEGPHGVLLCVRHCDAQRAQLLDTQGAQPLGIQGADLLDIQGVGHRDTQLEALHGR